MPYNDVEGGIIFLYGIGYIILPEDVIKPVILDHIIAENYQRAFDIVPNPEDVPNYTHNDLAKCWNRVY